MVTLREQMERHVDFEPARVERNGQAYVDTYNFVREELERYLARYHELDQINQTARLLRDQIDALIRRYHEYVIEGKIKAHYREVGLKPKDAVDFEHVIPARSVRNLLIDGVWTIDQALNSPTCLIRRNQHRKLKDMKLSKHTPNKWLFWQRYAGLKLSIETYDGTAVDQSAWDFEQHCRYFNIA